MTFFIFYNLLDVFMFVLNLGEKIPEIHLTHEISWDS